MLYTEKMFNEARMVAEKCHGQQAYDKIFPYTKHLDDVVGVLRRHGFSGRFIVAGYLHDAMEDGNLSYKDIENYFGLAVAEIVYCVTDELGRNREERKRKTLAKTAKNPDAIVIKLADRIANLEHGGKVRMYAEEHQAFLSALHSEAPDHRTLWVALNDLIVDSAKVKRD